MVARTRLLKLRIAFFISRYTATGVPLAQLRLARALARRGHDVDFVIGYSQDELRLANCDRLEVVVLKRPRTMFMLPWMVSYLRSNKPDVIFSAEDHMNAVSAFAASFAFVDSKISASSRITPGRVYRRKAGPRAILDAWMHRISRRRIDVLTCVSSDMAAEYEEMFGGGRYEIAYNIVVDRDSEQRMAEAVDDAWFTERDVPMIVTAGTLTRRKGLDILIDAVALVSQVRPVRLGILGEGYQRPNLQSRIDALGMTESIRLIGFVENPTKYFASCDVFALASYAEGLPNVLVEAMAAGCTVVSTDCPTGPAEVMQGGKYGYLVPMGDASAMASSILAALDRPIKHQLMQEAIAPFREDAVIARHQELLGYL